VAQPLAYGASGVGVRICGAVRFNIRSEALLPRPPTDRNWPVWNRKRMLASRPDSDTRKLAATLGRLSRYYPASSARHTR